jgi:hypothetical protein
LLILVLWQSALGRVQIIPCDAGEIRVEHFQPVPRHITLKDLPPPYQTPVVTGFLLDPAGPVTWGRPVGVLVLPDGSLLFTEEINGRIYRVRFSG